MVKKIEYHTCIILGLICVYLCGLIVQKIDHKKICGLCLGLLDQETKPQIAPWSMPWFCRPLQQTTFFLFEGTWSNRQRK